MFIHQNQLEYQLSPEHYYSPEQYELELKNVFLPAWHLVGIKQDCPNDGDFFTKELLGQPILVRNFDGELHAFLNVCSHRHCQITNEPRGNSHKITCQYHGWEYEKSGKTNKIPDAKCFRPFDRENAQLKKFRVKTCGEMVFVNLSEEGPTLKEFLGDFYFTWEHMFSVPRKHNWHTTADFDCNWKLPVENTVETYHIPCVHGKTLKVQYPGEESQSHILDEKFTQLKYDMSDEQKLLNLAERAAKRLGGINVGGYIHRLVHPHLVFTMTDLVMHAQIYLPTSPTTSKTEIWNFCLEGTGTSLKAKLIRLFLPRMARKLNEKIQFEDKAVFAPAQRGMEASRFKGCIGTREERVYVFQRYIAEKCGITDSNRKTLSEECAEWILNSENETPQKSQQPTNTTA